MTWFPLARAMVCLNDDTVFDLTAGVMTCPSCGSEAWIPLQVWIGAMREKADAKD